MSLCCNLSLKTDNVLTDTFLTGAMGPLRNLSRGGGGQNRQHFKRLTRFRRAIQKIEYFSSHRRRKWKPFAFSRRFRLNYRVSMASAEGSSENFRYFVGQQHITSLFQIPGGGGQVPCCPPVRVPMLEHMALGKYFTSVMVIAFFHGYIRAGPNFFRTPLFWQRLGPCRH